MGALRRDNRSVVPDSIPQRASIFRHLSCKILLGSCKIGVRILQDNRHLQESCKIIVGVRLGKAYLWTTVLNVPHNFSFLFFSFNLVTIDDCEYIMDKIVKMLMFGERKDNL